MFTKPQSDNAIIIQCGNQYNKYDIKKFSEFCYDILKRYRIESKTFHCLCLIGVHVNQIKQNENQYLSDSRIFNSS